MSIEKQSLYIGLQKDRNDKLMKIHDRIVKLHHQLSKDSPMISNIMTKYDLVAENVQEAILLFQFRQRKLQQLEEYNEKIKKMFRKL